jgi:hypothetical protein
MKRPPDNGESGSRKDRTMGKHKTDHLYVKKQRKARAKNLEAKQSLADRPDHLKKHQPEYYASIAVGRSRSTPRP